MNSNSLLQSLGGIFLSWLRVDRIRIAKQTGKMGTLEVDDLILIHGTIFRVLSCQSTSISEYETQAEMHLKLVAGDYENNPQGHWQLIVTARALPSCRCRGTLYGPHTEQELEASELTLLPKDYLRRNGDHDQST